jgi:DNA-binding beta-propeller fold protein YncE
MRALLFFVLASVGLAQAPMPELHYKVLPDWPHLPPGFNFRETPAITVDARGNVYVIHRGEHPIVEFTSDGTFIRSFGDGLYDRPHGIRIDAEGNIWTADDTSHMVIKMDPSGRVRMVLGRWRTTSEAHSSLAEPNSLHGSRGIRDNEIVRFNRPTDMAFAANGDIFVADGYGNSRVVKFSKDGRFLKEWGRRGSGEGEFHTPHSILVDSRNRVLVADRENYRIQIFDMDGKFLAQWTHVGAPWGLDLSKDGKELWMADGYNNRVLKLDLDGHILGCFGSRGKLPGQFSYVHHLAVGLDGSIYTAEILNWRPQKFVPGHSDSK